MTKEQAVWGLLLSVLAILFVALLIDTELNREITPIRVTEIVTEAPTTTSSTTTSTTTSTSTTTTTTVALVLPQSTESFFSCIKWRESRNNYEAVDPTGKYMGAYQFYQQGWDTFAQRIGRDDLVGVKPNNAAPTDQDAVALAAYNELGSRPWGGHCD